MPKASRQAAHLGDYRAKRDFTATIEPEPRPAPQPDPATGAHPPPATGTQRFVIHEHHASRLHWDLRLERDGVLACWALPKGLPEAPKDNRFAAATEDHPLEYLDFHGEIPKGQYGAGAMTIWDSGTYECLKWEPRKVEVALHGERLDARYALFPIDKDAQPKDWMIHRMDPPEDPEREPMPTRIVPMLASTGSLPADDGGWAYEIKWDGVRAIAYSRPGDLRLQSRTLNDITRSYPELGRLNRALSSHSAVLDGEIVALDRNGRPSFEALQRRMHVSAKAQASRLMKGTPVTYVIFDLLWLEGHSLIDEPYYKRRELLAALELHGESWRTPEHVLGDGAALLQASAEQHLEGVLAKRLDSTYRPGVRTRDWVKVKTIARQELVVGGWMPGKGRRSDTVGALLLGVYEPSYGAEGSPPAALRYVGRVGSGFRDSDLEQLARLLCSLRSSSPFTTGERPPKGALFCEPKLVVEVQFANWTDGGSLRAPVYKGLREDKPATEVVREDEASDAPREGGERDPSKARQRPKVHEHTTAGAGDDGGLRIERMTAGGAEASVAGRTLKLSNLAKPMYPASGFTKRELIEYYTGVAPVLLGHLEGRALTVTRWPDGVEGKSFFQKQAPAHRPEWVRTARIASAQKPIDYTLADDLPTLVWLANLAAIELHTPLARAEAIERPTALVFDLDPGAPAGILECCHVGLLLEGMFAGLGMQSFAKTSGSKGLQVYIPLNLEDASFAQTKPFAKAVAELLEEAEPHAIVSRMTKARRSGKVLIDWSQNDAKKTTVCVYSLRASERPTVSTPVDWEEVRTTLDGGDPASLSFQAGEVLARVAERGDLFGPVLSLVQTLPSF